MSYIKPKKQLGQHFLTDKTIAKRIVDSLAAPSGNILEIGPGKGILTEFLSLKENYYLIEIDKQCVDYIKESYPSLQNNIFFENFLKFDLKEIPADNLSIIGNFPYNISSQIFFKILEDKDKVNEIVCMLQKEVAQRIVSQPGNKEYGILSVLLQAYYNIEYLFTVKPGSFFPPPKVNSGVIRLTRNENKELDCNEKLFRQVIKASFNQRRKTLKNSLKSFQIDGSNDEIFSKRPEQLHYNEFIYITKLIMSLSK